MRPRYVCAAPEIPTEELKEYVELEQPPMHEPPRYSLRQRRPWLQNADDYVTSQQRRRNPRRVYNMTHRETWGVLPAKEAAKTKYVSAQLTNQRLTNFKI